jgi:hypothetical protein
MAGSGLRSLTSRLDQRRRTVLILLAVVVAILAAGGGGSAGSDSWTGIPGGRALSLVAQVGIVIGALLVLVTLVTLRHPRRLTARRQGNLQLVAMVVVFVALTRLLVGRQGELSAIDDVPAPPPAAVEPGIPVAGRAVTTTDLMVLVAIVAAGLAILWWAGRAAGDDGAA